MVIGNAFYRAATALRRGTRSKAEQSQFANCIDTIYKLTKLLIMQSLLICKLYPKRLFQWFLEQCSQLGKGTTRQSNSSTIMRWRMFCLIGELVRQSKLTLILK